MMKLRLGNNFFMWILFHIFEYWYYYIGAVVSLYFLHSFQSEIPILAKELGDKVNVSELNQVEIAPFFKLAIAILFFRTASRLLFFYPARVQQKNLRIEMIYRLEKSFPDLYKKLSSGDLFQRVVTDFNRIRGFIGFALLQFGNIIIAAFIFIPKINEFNENFLIAFSPLVACVILFSILIYFFQPLVRKNMDAYADVQNFMIESYEAKRSIKNFSAQQNFVGKFQNYSAKELRLFYLSSLGRAVSFPLTKLGVGASLIWGAYIVLENDLSGTDLIFFSGFLYLVMEPLLFLSWIGVVTSQGYAAWRRIKELVENTEKDYTEDWFQKSLDLNLLTLPFWEHEITLSFKKHQRNILIGDTGVGKSYVLENLAKNFHHLGIKYSYIQQEPYLYNATVYNNIFLGNTSSEEKVELAKDFLVLFGLDLLASSLDDVLALEVGENGKQISGGQAKRLALLRSLISDVDYVLWDDPFSSVDLILEKDILDKINHNKMLSKKTFIFTGHRLSTVRLSDWIIYLNKDVGIKAMGPRESELQDGKVINEYFKKQMV